MQWRETPACCQAILRRSSVPNPSGHYSARPCLIPADRDKLLQTGGRMRNWILAAILPAVVAVVAPAQQPAQQNTVVEIHVNRPKPGMQQQYESGRKRHGLAQVPERQVELAH